MASCIFFVNQKGEEVVSRHYRSDVSKVVIDLFRSKVIRGVSRMTIFHGSRFYVLLFHSPGKLTGQSPPVALVDGTSFLYIRHKNMFLCGATRRNPNPALILEFLFQKLRILKSYLGDDFTDENVKGNFTLIYELFDETMDYGYPQNCAVDVLKLYINQGCSNIQLIHYLKK